MPSQLILDKKYIDMAACWAELSRAVRNQVGCLIVKNGMIISDGYNGTPSGFDNICEIETDQGLVTKPEVLHAESNALSKLAKSTLSSEGATLYTTASPCTECAKLIIQSAIHRVVYKTLYKNDQGINLLKKANIKVECLK